MSCYLISGCHRNRGWSDAYDEGMDDDTLVANIADTGFPIDEDNMFVED
ncbi:MULTISPECIES: hypothetical protein [Psychrobacter]|nr:MULTISPECIES: hypothetical protein [Psychrobacter]